MKNHITSYIFLIFSICFLSCRKGDIELSKTIALPYFERIELNEVFEVYLTQDTTFSLQIECIDKSMDKIKYSVENNILTIDNKTKYKWLHPKDNKVKLYIHVDKIKSITANETCYIKTTNPIISNEFGLILKSKLNNANIELNCNSFYYWNNHPCGGELVLRGKTESLKIWNFALMAVDATNLLTKYALIENSSKSDCKVNVLQHLDYSIFGTGNIYLYGNPKEIKLHNQTSTGKLIKL